MQNVRQHILRRLTNESNSSFFLKRKQDCIIQSQEKSNECHRLLSSYYYMFVNKCCPDPSFSIHSLLESCLRKQASQVIRTSKVSESFVLCKVIHDSVHQTEPQDFANNFSTFHFNLADSPSKEDHLFPDPLLYHKLSLCSTITTLSSKPCLHRRM